jgi:hypothetical protein
MYDMKYLGLSINQLSDNITQRFNTANIKAR